MPVSVRKSRRNAGGWDIIETASGRKVGWSRSKRRARIAAGHRNRAWGKKRRRR